jgi:lipoprotein-anchoring transpeptidase ErfK/SrfK
LNRFVDCLDTTHIGEIDEAAMSKVRCYGSLTALLAAAVLTCGSARADSLFALFNPPPQSLIAPQQAAPDSVAPNAAEPDDQNAADQGTQDENAQLDPRLQRQVVNYPSQEAPGTIIVDTPHTYLYYVLGGGKAIRYGIGVGREGFTWAGVKNVVRKAEWPDWYPPPEMIKRQPYLPRVMVGGPGNPLGARAMYIGGTEYRIHGTNDPTTIGKHVSSGCIRLTNDNAIDLYNRVKIGTKVIVLPQNGATTHEAKAPTQNWQARAQAAIAASRAQHNNAAPAPISIDPRTSWNVARPAGLY